MLQCLNTECFYNDKNRCVRTKQYLDKDGVCTSFLTETEYLMHIAEAKRCR